MTALSEAPMRHRRLRFFDEAVYVSFPGCYTGLGRLTLTICNRFSATSLQRG